MDGLSNTIETPHAHIKCFNDAFAAYADNNGIYCVKPFHHPGPDIRTVSLVVQDIDILNIPQSASVQICS